MMHLVLASASPRRADLLRAAGYSFEVLAVDVDERRRPGEAAADYVRRLASEKSAAALAQVRAAASSSASRTEDVPPLVLLAADTVVVVDEEVFGKPRDDSDATAMLRRLSGRSHEVMTGVSVRRAGRELTRVDVTSVEFSPLSEAEIAWYVAQGEGRDKAGGYAIQGLASRFVPCISGSYSNVVGLPVATVCALLVEIASVEGSGYPVK